MDGVLEVVLILQPCEARQSRGTGDESSPAVLNDLSVLKKREPEAQLV
jgi:hypothetical protein